MSDRFTVATTADSIIIMDRQEHRIHAEWDMQAVFDQYQRGAIERCRAINALQAKKEHSDA